MDDKPNENPTAQQWDSKEWMIRLAKLTEYLVSLPRLSIRNVSVPTSFPSTGYDLLEESRQRSIRDLREMEKDLGAGKSCIEALEAFRKRIENPALSEFPTTTTTTTSRGSYMERRINLYDFLTKDEQEKIMKKVEEAPPELTLADLNILYLRGLEALQQGRYRESFTIFKPCLSFFASNPLVWFRISEACILEFYEESFEFSDTYRRLFGKNGRLHVASRRRQANEMRPRHPDMNLRYTEYVALVSFTLARFSKKRDLQFAAAKNWVFLMLKFKRYREALEAISYIFLKTAKRPMSSTEMSQVFLFKAEAMLYTGNTNRCIEYSLKACEMANDRRLRARSMMFAAMGYAKKNNYTKACDVIQDLMRFELLDVALLENVILFGLHMSYKMNNVEMLQHFIQLLQELVY